MAARAISSPVPNGGGWLTGLAEDLLTREDVCLGVCFPLQKQPRVLSGKVGRLTYYGFPQNKNPAEYNGKTETYLKWILNDFRPDIVHIFGTEYPHALAMTKAFHNPHRTIVNLQGLCSVIALHYDAALPERVLKSHTLRDFVKRDGIRQQRKKFKKRGAFEIQALRNVNHVVGRTTWDRACALRINPEVCYHFCNETLRDSFYHAEWNLSGCEKHSIFVSQGGYPVKGLHFMLEAMPEIRKRYPDARLYVAGENIIKADTLRDKLRKRSYWVYIRKLIRNFGLEGSVIFTGELDERQMCRRLLKSHMFVLPSSIENSSNALGEAMLLGVPCVASNAGGTCDMIVDRSEGYVYPYDEPYMLAYYVCGIFGDDDLALKFSQNAREHALKTHDKEKNLSAMVDIYKGIMEE